MDVYNYLLKVKERKGAGYLILVDPDTRKDSDLEKFVKLINESDVDAVLVGGSLLFDSDFQECARIVKSASNIPVIIFPGSVKQISGYADAILFISLISGRNPYYLFGEHVIAAPVIKRLGIEAISTGYMLIESGRMTTAEYMSNTKPLPSDKPEIAAAHALAAQYMGMKMIYLEAGSGAENSVPNEMVEIVSRYVEIPVIVGGGIRDPETAKEKVESGASFVVTGNVLNDNSNLSLIKEFADAIHVKGNK
ncbi:MAG: geranylgeranylglyceryl/heptaprenylglyceryl phosphate synthase [Candidatus Marinimicrobia bacterium]|nr:geranylgeranylglyceryl/heptaprenylglyceryl phosphate synthase [Candidatus Neomarinimicrobiota bacterium]